MADNVIISDKLQEIQGKKKMSKMDKLTAQVKELGEIVRQQEEELLSMRERIISVSLALEVLYERKIITSEEIDAAAGKLLKTYNIKAGRPDSVEDKEDAGSEGVDSDEHSGEPVPEGLS